MLQKPPPINELELLLLIVLQFPATIAEPVVPVPLIVLFPPPVITLLKE
jgi:hypothetical protein